MPMTTSSIIVDADHAASGWEIVLRFDVESAEGIWSDISDERLPLIVGENIAALLINERDSQRAR